MGFLFQSGQKMDLLKTSQENLALTQKNLELMMEQHASIAPATATVDTADDQVDEIAADAMKRAAYALNCCTVSVSQIIDYDDVYILEQEYESILNNLNLEVMPKDEALLDILKQLLNTITFFRIQEGDKAMLDKEYQHRMQNAIWSAVPNIGMIVAGGNWATAAVSLVSQIGIGYMNYRREKAQNQMDHEKQQWQLMRSAIEQFNGLRRELFDTAWRLADKYNFPDSYRITERQISIYNRILMEPDPLKRYERLAYIQDKFIAYPPFLYHLASAASAVALSPADSYPDKLKSLCAKEAQKHFQEYIDATEKNLFREDQIRATCALEYFNLLLTTGAADNDTLHKLLKIALDAAGNSYDILEMCAFAYAKLDMPTDAIRILRMLVNEDYNTVVNAQLLSSLYVQQYIATPTEDTLIEYQTLSSRVSPKHLFPMPSALTGSITQFDNLNREFFSCQKKILMGKYAYVLKQFVEKYTIRFNRAIPTANEKDTYPDVYFINDVEAIQQRAQDILALFDKGKEAGYISRLHFVTQDMFAVLNAVCVAIDQLPFVSGRPVLHSIKTAIAEHSNTFVELQEKISKGILNADDIRTLFGLTFEMFTESAFTLVVESIKNHISSLESMPEISEAEAMLREFCKTENIQIPELTLASTSLSIDVKGTEDSDEITIDLLGEKASAYQREMGKIKRMEEYIKAFHKANDLIRTGASKIAYYERGMQAFDDYFIRNATHLKKVSWNVLAVINDTSSHDEDWLLTSTGIRRFHRSFFTKEVSIPTAYSQIKTNGKGQLQLRVDVIDDDRINLSALMYLVQKLALIEKEFSPTASERIDLPDATDGGMALRLSTALFE